ncbi:hypothetical protein H312_01023 [Anncaliia algerae PRA339]|uniref:Uncharacterized protein n=1 Tax=Anncaliia algerae PRA339 TaxID=1288291 RepID=A0A059F3M4_9MICR|nr:hypothetical protein H312_01023 [Anncaliia algerae PRA339]
MQFLIWFLFCLSKNDDTKMEIRVVDIFLEIFDIDQYYDELGDSEILLLIDNASSLYELCISPLLETFKNSLNKRQEFNNNLEDYLFRIGDYHVKLKEEILNSIQLISNSQGKKCFNENFISRTIKFSRSSLEVFAVYLEESCFTLGMSMILLKIFLEVPIDNIYLNHENCLVLAITNPIAERYNPYNIYYMSNCNIKS